MQIDHPVRRCIGLLSVFVLVLLAYAVWSLWDTSHQLSAASDDALSAKAKLLDGDGPGAQAALGDFARHTANADNRTRSPVWSLMTTLPWVGADARGIRTVSQVADDVSTGGLQPLAAAAGNLGDLLPHKGVVDVATVRSLQAPVAQSDATLARAHDELAHADQTGYSASLKVRFNALAAGVDRASRVMRAADRALAVSPVILGSQGPRNYLVVLQNNAEIRATGGLAASMVLFHVDGGHVTFAKQATATSFGAAPQSVLPLTSEEKVLFGDNVGRLFGDGNLTPDFPRSAALWEARWEQTEGDHVDGVISVDAVSISYLLDAIGPVTVDGVHLTAANVVTELLSDVYARLPSPADQDDFYRDVASSIFTRLATFSGSVPGLVGALQRSASEHRLLISDTDADVQRQLDATELAGRLPSRPTAEPEVGVYFADGTLSKMSYYLRYDAHVSSTACVDGTQTLSGSLTLQSVAPIDAKQTLSPSVTGTNLPKSSAGYQLLAIQIFGPTSGTVGRVGNDKAVFDQSEAEYEGRMVRTVYVLLKPGQVADLTWDMTTGSGQTGAGSVAVTPSVEPGDQSSTFATAC